MKLIVSDESIGDALEDTDLDSEREYISSKGTHIHTLAQVILASQEATCKMVGAWLRNAYLSADTLLATHEVIIHACDALERGEFPGEVSENVCIKCHRPLVVQQYLDHVDTPEGKMCVPCSKDE